MPANEETATTETPIRVVFGDTVLSARLWDNPTARDLIAQLPLTLTFSDYGRQEKLARLPRRLTMEGVPAGDDPLPGELGYYAPAGVIVFYYEDVSYFTGIVRLGRFDDVAGAINAL
ncbi:MAG: cyclophilin-like fold protein, partial [Anaerolineales bacterium]|nr:cyclophilin-like fold protein [Anaerolineales bacterium]